MDEFPRIVDDTYPFTYPSLSREITLLSRDLSINHTDLADQFIAATVYALNEPLVTKDTNILELSWLNTINA